jgi:DNA-binding transcriptional LysR family regulator
MDWDDLHLVLAISRGRSLARAATALGVTHTTVGRRLAALEQQLGVHLFARTPDGLVATAAGQDLADTAEPIEAEVHAASARVQGRDAELRGPIRVTTLDFLFERYRPVFADFVERYPDVALTVTSPVERVSLTRRDADVAVRLTNAPAEHLLGRRVDRIQFAVYAARTLVESLGPDPRWEALPWIGWDERLEAETRWLTAWWAQHAPGARVVLRVDDNARVRRTALLAGIGAFFLPTFEGDALPELCRVGPVLTATDQSVWLLTLRELRATRRIRVLLDHLETGIRAAYPAGP